MNTWWHWVTTILVIVVCTVFCLYLLAGLVSRDHHMSGVLGSSRPRIWRYRRSSRQRHRRYRMKGSWLMPNSVISRAVREAIKTGLLIYDVPAEMIQGKKERVEVRIARSTDLREAVVSGWRGLGKPQFEEIETSYYMEVKLSGKTFEITSDSLPEQLIIPTPARWEFDVLPCRAGRQTITLSVNMRIEVEGIVEGRRGVSVLNKQIDVQVDRAFAVRRFFTNNWQWLIAAALALAGTIAAWLVVPF